MGFSKSIGRIAALWGMAMIGAACAGNEAKEASSAAPEPIRIGPESVAVVKEEELRTGPIISGQLSAEREATVRAQVGGSIVQTTLDEGQAVSKGAVLARIEARDLNDAVTSAQVGVRSAEAALALAQSEAQRTETLVKGGALATRDLEAALNAVATASLSSPPPALVCPPRRRNSPTRPFAPRLRA